MIEFPPFRLDTVRRCLWRRKDAEDDECISLAPKPFAVLKYLVEHAGNVVTQTELLDTLWPDTFVQPEVLKTHILDIRSTLGDSAKNSRFIETLPREGYRFIAPVSDPAAEAKLTPVSPSRKLVGRNATLVELRNCLGRSLRDRREIVFITGEMGIGKTALVDEFLRRTTADFRGMRMARGQCVEGYGSKEAYYPMLEAMYQLCGASGGDAVVRTLAAQAPTWLVQFPALVKREQHQTLQREILGATRERMLREIAEALETISSEKPLLLVLEDLHWADPSTVDVLSTLARRRARGKLMLIGTYRPVDVALAEHPLKIVKQDLLVHQLCREIALEPLGEAEVAEYLEAEAGGAAVPEGLSELIYRHTEGNPLFMVAALDHMRNRGVLAVENGDWQIKAPREKLDLGAPDSLRQMIELQIERLSAGEQRVLEVVSLVKRFPMSVTVGSAVANLEPEAFEELLEGLARRHQVVRAAGCRNYRSGPSPCYELVHVLYREVVYSRIGVARKRKLHRSIAEIAEAAHLVPGEGAATDLPHHEVVSELAYQFEEGSDWPRAVKYLLLEADNAGRRFEPRQAAAILEHALKLVNRIPEPDRAPREIEILQKLAAIYSSSRDPRAAQTYEDLAARAAKCGLPDVEVRAVLDGSFPLASAGLDHYLRAVERVGETLPRFEEGDDLAWAATRAIYLGRRMGAGVWSPGDLEECKTLVRMTRGSSDRRLIAEVLSSTCYTLRNFSEYREAYTNADEAFAILLEGYEENPYLSSSFLMHENLVSTCLCLLGEWGEALRKIEQYVKTVEKNGDRLNTIIAGLTRPALQIEAMDFTGALQALDPMPSAASAIPQIRRYCLVFGGLAAARLGQPDRALEQLLAARDEMDRHALMSDWHNRMPLQQALTEVWLAKGDLAQALLESEQFLKVSLATGEHTYRALAYEANARLAIAEGDLPKAVASITQAVQEMEGYEVPLAAWRVHATASGLYESIGDRDSAERYRVLSRATIMKLANSLPDEEPLRRTFLTAPMIRNILGDDQVPRLPGEKVTPAH